MKKTILLLAYLFILGTGILSAQTVRPQEFVSELAAPVNGASVKVTADPQLSAILNRSKSLDGKMVEGYRVYIFLDNSQNAREKGLQARARFNAAFPDIPADISYENPYWKVSVGNCLSKDEAMIVFGRVKRQFTSAYIRKENMPLKNFLRYQAIASKETEESNLPE